MATEEELDLMVNNKLLVMNFCVLLLLALGSCSSNRVKNPENNLASVELSDRSSTEAKGFTPDTTINQKIFLIDAPSIEKHFKDIEKIPKYNDYVFVLNKSGEQCLSLHVNYGGLENEYQYFDVFYKMDTEISKEEAYSKINFDSITFFQSDFTEFTTESNIKLGVSKQEVIKAKGKSYQTTKNGDTEVLKYQIDINNSTQSAFLARYNMPVYIAKYYFRKGSLVRFAYGFKTP